MKRNVIMIAALAAFAAACTNLDEEIYSQIPKEEFLKEDSNVALYTARP